MSKMSRVQSNFISGEQKHILRLENKDIENVIKRIISRQLYAYNYAESKSINFIILSRDTIFIFWK